MTLLFEVILESGLTRHGLTTNVQCQRVPGKSDRFRNLSFEDYVAVDRADVTSIPIADDLWATSPLLSVGRTRGHGVGRRQICGGNEDLSPIHFCKSENGTRWRDAQLKDLVRGYRSSREGGRSIYSVLYFTGRKHATRSETLAIFQGSFSYVPAQGNRLSLYV